MALKKSTRSTRTKANAADASGTRTAPARQSGNRRLTQRQKRREAQIAAERMKRIRIAGLVIIGILVVAVAIVWRNAGIVPADGLQATLGPNIDGPEDAPVRVVEFGDFGCPSCRAWHQAGVKDQLRTEFGDQVSFEFRHFPVITAQSPKAAEASQCAAEQGAFWEYHDYLYEFAPPGALGTADLKVYASALGLESGSFEDCLDSGKYQDYVTQDMRDAAAAGAGGTPSFFIDGRPISFSYAGMAVAIEEALGD